MQKYIALKIENDLENLRSKRMQRRGNGYGATFLWNYVIGEKCGSEIHYTLFIHMINMEARVKINLTNGSLKLR